MRHARICTGAPGIGLPGLILLLLATGCGEAEERHVGRPGGEKPPPIPDASAPAEESGSRNTITWTGCDISKKAYMLKAASEYTKLTGVEIVVTGGGATRGIRATAGGSSDIGGTCRHCLPKDVTEERDAVMTLVAWDALVFCTHLSNPVVSITEEEACEILIGTTTNWKDIAGGVDANIVPAFRVQTKAGKLSGVGYMTRLLLFNNTDEKYTKKAIFHRSSGPIEKFVEATPYSFAVTGVSSANKRHFSVLQLNGVTPGAKEIASGDYPLYRPLYLVTKGRPSGAAGKFIDWILGPVGQAVLKEAGTVNLKDGAKLKREYKHWPADTGRIWNY